MKKLRKIFTASLLFLICIITYGQKPYIDSINVQIDDNIELRMSIYEYSGLVENIENDIKSLQSILINNNDIPEKSSYSIIYVPDKSLSIRQTEPIEKIIWENGNQSIYHFNNLCNINSDKYSLKIKYNELEELVSDSLYIKIKEVIDTTNTIRGRFATTYNYSFQGENMFHNKQFDEINGQMDVLILKGGLGANLIKNQPVIDLSAEIGIMFSKKGLLKNQYYLSYNQLYDFSNNSEINLNHFANIGYKYNFSNTANSTNWLGIEFGYLFKQQGGMFDNNTFRIGVNWETGKYINIAPHLYLSGHSTFPAIRIGFGL